MQWAGIGSHGNENKMQHNKTRSHTHAHRVVQLSITKLVGYFLPSDHISSIQDTCLKYCRFLNLQNGIGVESNRLLFGGRNTAELHEIDARITAQRTTTCTYVVLVSSRLRLPFDLWFLCNLIIRWPWVTKMVWYKCFQ